MCFLNYASARHQNNARHLNNAARIRHLPTRLLGPKQFRNVRNECVRFSSRVFLVCCCLSKRKKAERDITIPSVFGTHIRRSCFVSAYHVDGVAGIKEMTGIKFILAKYSFRNTYGDSISEGENMLTCSQKHIPCQPTCSRKRSITKVQQKFESSTTLWALQHYLMRNFEN